MRWLSRVLETIKLVHPFTEDDRLNAETENAVFDLDKGKEALDNANARQAETNKRLQRVMRDARIRVQEFANLEERVRASMHQGKDLS